MKQNHLSKQETKNLPIISLLLLLIGSLSIAIYINLSDFVLNAIKGFLVAFVDPGRNFPLINLYLINGGIIVILSMLITLAFFVYSILIIKNSNGLRLIKQLHSVQILNVLVSLSGAILAVLFYRGLAETVSSNKVVFALSIIRIFASIAVIWFADRAERRIDKKMKKFKKHTIAFSKNNLTKIRVASISLVIIESIVLTLSSAPLLKFESIRALIESALFIAPLYAFLGVVISLIITATSLLLMRSKVKRYKAINRVSRLRNLSLANLVIFIFIIIISLSRDDLNWVTTFLIASSVILTYVFIVANDIRKRLETV